MGYGTGWTAEASSRDLCFYEQLDIESNFYKWLNDNATEYRVEPFIYITYNVNGSIIIKRQSANSLISIDEPQLAGTKFNGWSLMPNGTALDIDTYLLTDDTTLYALFEEIPSNSGYYKNGNKLYS